MITYNSICEKLGFAPFRKNSEHKGDIPDHEDDSIVNPFSILTREESDFLSDYLDEHSGEFVE